MAADEETVARCYEYNPNFKARGTNLRVLTDVIEARVEAYSIGGSLQSQP
jgi:hypothetical protein